MLGSLHKNTLKTAVPRWFPNGSQMVPKMGGFTDPNRT